MNLPEELLKPRPKTKDTRRELPPSSKPERKARRPRPPEDKDSVLSVLVSRTHSELPKKHSSRKPKKVCKLLLMRTKTNNEQGSSEFYRC
jgi:hypothetical protein